MKILTRRLLPLGALLAALFLASCQRDDKPVAQSTPAPIKVIDTIMVPGADDLLHPKKVSRLALDTQLKSGGNPAPALDEIIKLSPKWFPKGTRVEDVKETGNVVTVLLSPEFGNAKHWSQGETTTQIAVYSLVNTLAKNDKKVALTIEGKPIPSLGEMDMKEALPADPSLNAPAKSSVTAASTAAAPTGESTGAPKAALGDQNANPASANSASANSASANSASATPGG